MQHPGWLLVIVGLALALAGAVWLLVPSIGGIGRLPGDVVIERENFRFYFPIVTCLVVSLVLSGIFWLVRFFSR